MTGGALAALSRASAPYALYRETAGGSEFAIQGFGQVVVIDQADDGLDFSAIAGIKHARRQPQNAAKLIGDFVVAEENGVVHRILRSLDVEPLPLNPRLDHLLAIVVHGHAQNHKPLRAVFVI